MLFVFTDEDLKKISNEVLDNIIKKYTWIGGLHLGYLHLTKDSLNLHYRQKDDITVENFPVLWLDSELTLGVLLDNKILPFYKLVEELRKRPRQVTLLKNCLKEIGSEQIIEPQKAAEKLTSAVNKKGLKIWLTHDTLLEFHPFADFTCEPISGTNLYFVCQYHGNRDYCGGIIICHSVLQGFLKYQQTNLYSSSETKFSKEFFIDKVAIEQPVFNQHYFYINHKTELEVKFLNSLVLKHEHLGYFIQPANDSSVLNLITKSSTGNIKTSVIDKKVLAQKIYLRFFESTDEYLEIESYVEKLRTHKNMIIIKNCLSVVNMANKSETLTVVQKSKIEVLLCNFPRYPTLKQKVAAILNFELNTYCSLDTESATCEQIGTTNFYLIGQRYYPKKKIEMNKIEIKGDYAVVSAEELLQIIKLYDEHLTSLQTAQSDKKPTVIAKSPKHKDDLEDFIFIEKSEVSSEITSRELPPAKASSVPQEEEELVEGFTVL